MNGDTDVTLSTTEASSPNLGQDALPPAITLTEEQNLALDRILEWAKGPVPEFRLGGFAGTGKTTILKVVNQRLRELKLTTKVCAFTGKAVNVLQRKGINSQTAHSMMYDAHMDPETHAVEFIKRPVLNCDPDVVIWDEASMVSKELLTDVRSFNKKILWVGDPGQLEPVGDNPDLMKEPDFVLQKIHRQVEGNPIIALATTVRLGGSMQHVEVDGLCIKDKSLKASEALGADQVICAKNKTRQGMNDKLRQQLGHAPFQVVEGEKLICLRNNMNLGLFNGMILFVKKMREKFWDRWIVDSEDEVGNKFPRLAIWTKPFTDSTFDEKNPGVIPKKYAYCTYGYVITCHKSQGSEWGHVLVYDEDMPPHIWDMKRWRYTAITRAAKRLTYCI